MSARSRLRVLPAALLVAGLTVVVPASPASAATHTVTTIDDTVDADVGDGICADADGECSLRAAVQEANASDEADVIELEAGVVYELTITGSGEDDAATGDLDVVGDLTVRSAGVPAVIDASALGDRIFDVGPDGRLALGSVDLRGGTATDDPLASGGAILNAGTLETTDVSITDSAANRAGGGIESSPDSTTTLLRTTLSGNVTGDTPGNGGGFHLTGEGTVTITDSTVTDNVAANEGGGLWNSAAGTMTVTNTVVSGNEAQGAEATAGGGGIFNQPDADETGGGTLVVTGATITDNHATGAAGSGGGIFNSRGTATISDTVVTGNSAPRAGGGLEALDGTTTLIDVDFADNTTGANPGNGGAVHLTGPGTVEVLRGSATGNVAANEGGGYWNSAAGTMTITDVVVVDNTAEGNGGGGLFNQGGTMDVANTVVTGNDAPRGGGVLDIDDGDTTLVHVTITDNTAPDGSGVAVDGNTVTLVNSIVAGNSGGDDCTATGVASRGGNAVGGCDVAGPNDVTGVDDPLLGDDLVPLAGSPSIDIGVEAECLPVDLAGRTRPLDGDADGVAVCDAGAFEAPATDPDPTDPPPTVPDPTVPDPADPTDPAAPAPGPGGTAPGAAGPGALPATGTSTLALVSWALLLLAAGAGALWLRASRDRWARWGE